MVQTLTAAVFHKFMTTGRTSPMLTTCVAHSDDDIDVVVKLNGGMDMGTRGAVFEVLAAQIAGRLGIAHPRPFLVWLSQEFIEIVALKEPEKAIRMSNSAGWNFGSEMLKDSIVWTPSAALPVTMQSDALQIFCFDGLIQNPDRCYANPNLIVQGDKLTVIDHECAFSFLFSFLPSLKPWTMGTGDYMERHALRTGLRGNALSWITCITKFQTLDDEFLDSLEDGLPPQWKASDDLDAIKNHVSAVLRNLELFEAELQRRIA